MTTRQARRSVWAIISIVVLFYVSYAVTRPPKRRAQAQRITAVNAAPRLVTMTLSNGTPPGAAKP